MGGFLLCGSGWRFYNEYESRRRARAIINGIGILIHSFQAGAEIERGNGLCDRVQQY
jgi:hypothetical protein